MIINNFKNYTKKMGKQLLIIRFFKNLNFRSIIIFKNILFFKTSLFINWSTFLY